MSKDYMAIIDRDLKEKHDMLQKIADRVQAEKKRVADAKAAVDAAMNAAMDTDNIEVYTKAKNAYISARDSLEVWEAKQERALAAPAMAADRVNEVYSMIQEQHKKTESAVSKKLRTIYEELDKLVSEAGEQYRRECEALEALDKAQQGEGRNESDLINITHDLGDFGVLQLTESYQNYFYGDVMGKAWDGSRWVNT